MAVRKDGAISRLASIGVDHVQRGVRWEQKVDPSHASAGVVESGRGEAGCGLEGKRIRANNQPYQSGHVGVHEERAFIAGGDGTAAPPIAVMALFVRYAEAEFGELAAILGDIAVIS